MKNIVGFFLLMFVFFCCESKEKEIKDNTKILFSDFIYGKEFSLDTVYDINLYANKGEILRAIYKRNTGFTNISMVKVVIDSVGYIFDINCVPNNCFGGPFIKSKNELLVYEDSVVKPSYSNRKVKYSIDSLEYAYQKDILNNGKEFYLSDSPEHLVLGIVFEDTTSVKRMKKVLSSVIKSHQKIEEKLSCSLPLNISIEHIIPPEPPPLLED